MSQPAKPQHFFSNDRNVSVSRQLLLFLDPIFTDVQGIDGLIERATKIRSDVSDVQRREWRATVILPTNYGPWTQAACEHRLPSDLVVSEPEDLAEIRRELESHDLGIGAACTPVNVASKPREPDDARAPHVRIPEMCAEFAAAAGFMALRFGDAWLPGNDPSAINRFYKRFWLALGDEQREVLKGNTCVVLSPAGSALDRFDGSIGPLTGGGEQLNSGQTQVNRAGGITAIGFECPGGPKTADCYPYPEQWPSTAFSLGHVSLSRVDWGQGQSIFPILDVQNLPFQIRQAEQLGRGIVGVMGV